MLSPFEWLVSQLHSTRDLQTMSFLFLRNLFYPTKFTIHLSSSAKNTYLPLPFSRQPGIPLKSSPDNRFIALGFVKSHVSFSEYSSPTLPTVTIIPDRKRYSFKRNIMLSILEPFHFSSCLFYVYPSKMNFSLLSSYFNVGLSAPKRTRKISLPESSNRTLV